MDFSGITLKAKNEVHHAKKKIQSALAQQTDPVSTGNPRRVVSGPGNAEADPKRSGRKRDHDIPVGNIQFHSLPETVSRSAHPGKNNTYSTKNRNTSQCRIAAGWTHFKILAGTAKGMVQKKKGRSYWLNGKNTNKWGKIYFKGNVSRFRCSHWSKHVRNDRHFCYWNSPAGAVLTKVSTRFGLISFPIFLFPGKMTENHRNRGACMGAAAGKFLFFLPKKIKSRSFYEPDFRSIYVSVDTFRFKAILSN